MQSRKLGIPTIKQAIDVALEVLLPQPCTPGRPTPITNLCVIGNEITGAERDRLVQWPRRWWRSVHLRKGPNPLERNPTLLLRFSLNLVTVTRPSVDAESGSPLPGETLQSEPASRFAS